MVHANTETDVNTRTKLYKNSKIAKKPETKANNHAAHNTPSVMKKRQNNQSPINQSIKHVLKCSWVKT